MIRLTLIQWRDEFRKLLRGVESPILVLGKRTYEQRVMYGFKTDAQVRVKSGCRGVLETKVGNLERYQGNLQNEHSDVKRGRSRKS